MNGELAQLVALATYGTAWLAGADGPPPPIERSNSTFRYVRSINFTVQSRLRRRRALAGVGPWLQHMREAGVTRLWLVIPPPDERDGRVRWVDPHLMSAFAGAGTWLLLGNGRRASETWRPSWEVGDRDDADHRIWDVTYTGARAMSLVIPSRPSLTEAHEHLRASLSAIHEFALERDLSAWSTDFFALALAALDADAPDPPYHPDLLPPSWPATARRLAAAATQAWVFGGMGSWNDLGFDAPADNDRYREVSRDLYGSVLEAFVAAVNADT